MTDQAKQIAKGLWEANKELAEEIAHEIYELRDKEPEEVLYNDWRLPTIKELITLTDYSSHEPVCFDKNINPGGYWSSTIYKGYEDDAHYVYLGNGLVYYDFENGCRYVRCVRDGENRLEWSADAPMKMSWDDAMEYAKSLVAPVAFRKENRDD